MALTETDKQDQAAFKSICTPFLTKKEINMISKDQDLYIHSDDKTLKERIERHFK